MPPIRGRIESMPSALVPTYGSHTIAFPAPSAGGRAQAMATHRQARPTPRGSGKRDPQGGLPSPPTSLRGPCDAPASRRATRLTGRTWMAVVWVPYVGTRALG